MIIDGQGWRTDGSGRRAAHLVVARQADPEPSPPVAARSLVVVSWVDHDPVHDPLLALFGILPLSRAGFGHRTRRWLNVGLRWSPTIREVRVVVVAALWINQQAHPSRLMHA